MKPDMNMELQMKHRQIQGCECTLCGKFVDPHRMIDRVKEEGIYLCLFLRVCPSCKTPLEDWDKKDIKDLCDRFVEIKNKK